MCAYKWRYGDSINDDVMFALSMQFESPSIKLAL